MTIPMVKDATVFDAITATETKEMAAVGDLGQAFVARCIWLEINGGSTPNWTLDIQGRVSRSGTWHNIDYFRIDQGSAQSPSASQLTVNWSTAQYYRIDNPPPFVRLVAARTGGSLTVKASFSSASGGIGPISVGIANGQTVLISPFQGNFTDRSGTITSGGSSQQVMAANSARKYLLFQNHSDTDMWINFGTAAVANQPSIKIEANGGGFVMEGSTVETGAMNVICATTGKAFTAKEV